eukprot:scaffold15744_cov69-Phaeocystis_antarctica.AAC.2
MLKLVAPPKKKRRSAAAIAPSISGTACPPSCHSVVIFSQRDGTLLSCAALSSSSALPSTCKEGTVINWGTSRSMLVGRRSHGVLQKLMNNWSDGERAATAAAMSAPSEMPQMPLIGACCSIQRSTCRTLSQTAAARLASSTDAESQPKKLARLYSPAAARLANSSGAGLTACGASRNSTSKPCALSSASQPVSSSILRISAPSPALPALKGHKVLEHQVADPLGRLLYQKVTDKGNLDELRRYFVTSVCGIEWVVGPVPVARRLECTGLSEYRKIGLLAGSCHSLARAKYREQRAAAVGQERLVRVGAHKIPHVA